ncbi:hypothetical protein GCM10010123_19430 [Pilimelia anulata]|uniref:Uncharacterized protein n=2 Tax=Pilimelia anulata TaxID=53371 RepID=A0A8J3F8K4_9ACTN|nr:hypothetical protein GCM10010123_19430 [Pilimelia anulata]
MAGGLAPRIYGGAVALMTRTAAVRVLRWAAVVVIAVEVLLVATGVLDLGDAVVIAVGLEVLCALLALALAVAARAVYRRLRRDGESRSEALLQAAGTVLPRPVVSLLRHEVGGVLSIGMLLRGRKDVPAGAAVIRYGGAHKAFLIVMMVLAPVEILLAELFIPWAWLRLTLLVLAVYGVVWLFGLYAGIVTRPHYVDGHRLVVRMGHLASASVDLRCVRSVRRESASGYKGLVSVRDGVVAVPGMNGTGLTAVLTPDAVVRVQGRGAVTAGQLRFDADDLSGAQRSIHDSLATRSS